MRRGRIFLFLILIVVVGLALLYFAYTQFVAGGVTPTTVAPQTQVYYAAQNIPQGTPITLEMLDTFSLPPENVAAVMFTVGAVLPTVMITLEDPVAPPGSRTVNVAV